MIVIIIDILTYIIPNMIYEEYTYLPHYHLHASYDFGIIISLILHMMTLK